MKSKHSSCIFSIKKKILNFKFTKTQYNYHYNTKCAFTFCFLFLFAYYFSLGYYIYKEDVFDINQKIKDYLPISLIHNKDIKTNTSEYAIVSTCIPGIRSLKFDNETIYASFYNKQRYCNLQNIDCILISNTKNDNLNKKWTKIQILLNYLSFYKFLVWLDCDAIITNYSKSFKNIYKIYNPNEEYDLIVSNDSDGYNLGVFLIKNSFSSMNILSQMYYQRYELSKNSFLQDQIAFKNFLKENHNYKNKVKVISQTLINSFPFYWKANSNWKKGHFVKHICDFRTQYTSLNDCKYLFLESAFCEETKNFKNFKICTKTYDSKEKIVFPKNFSLNIFLKQLKKYPKSIFIDIGFITPEFSLAALSQGHIVYAFPMENYKKDILDISLKINNFKKKINLRVYNELHLFHNLYNSLSIPLEKLRNRNILININTANEVCYRFFNKLNLFEISRIVYLQNLDHENLYDTCLEGSSLKSFNKKMIHLKTFQNYEIYKIKDYNIEIPKDAIMEKRQVERIYYILKRTPNPKLLVFGLGYDSLLWHNLGNNKTIFIENDKNWFYKIKERYPFLKTYLVDYHTHLKDSLTYLSEPDLWFELDLKDQLPAKIYNYKWDIIIVDSPRGDGSLKKNEKNIPGRSQSIYTASKLIKPGGNIFVDDCNRPIEKNFANMILGYENLIAVETREDSGQQCHYVYNERKEFNDLETIKNLKNLILQN